MAGLFIQDQSIFENSGLPTEEDRRVEWNDYGRTIVGGAGQLGAGIAGAVEYATGGALGSGVRRYLQRGAEEILERRSPVARQAAGSSFLPDRGELGVFDVGLGRALGLKGAAALPSLVASIIPGGLAGAAVRAAGASRLAAGAVGATVAQGAEAVMVGGGISAELRRTVDQMSDADLSREVPIYAGYRSMGLSEEEARARYTNDIEGAWPLVGYALGAVPGLEATLAGRIAGRAAVGGALRGARRGAVREAGQEALQSGGEAISTQQALIGGDLLDQANWEAVLAQAVEGAVVGGMIGAAGGAAAGAGGARPANPRPSRVPKQVSEVAPPPQMPVAGTPQKPATSSMPIRAAEQVTQALPEASTPGGLSASPPAPPPATVPPSTLSPKRSARRYPKGAEVVPQVAAPVINVDPVTPAPDVAAALASSTPSVAPRPGVAPVTPEVTPPVPGVPPVSGFDVSTETGTAPEQTVAEPVQVPPQTDSQIVAPQAPEAAAPPPAPIGPRILPDLSQRAQQSREEAARVEAQVAADVERAKAAEQPVEPKGKKWSKAQKTARAKTNKAATEILAQHTPAEEEAQFERRSGKAIVARAAIMKRAKAMLAAAKERGVAIPTRIEESTDPEMSYNDAVLALAEARTLASKKAPKLEDFKRFVTREYSLRAGLGQEVREERKQEGAQAKQAKPTEAPIVAAQQAATEEQAAQVEAAEEAVEPPTTGEPEERVVQAPAVSKEDVETKPKGAAKREVKVFDEEKAAEIAAKSAKRVEITDELRKKYEQPAKPKSTSVPPAVTSKVTPKVADVKTKVEAAAQRVDKKATLAQRDANNFRAGPVSIQGLRMSIKFVKGQERNGKKSPAHYGDILGVEGADGDPIDVFIGPKPDSDFVAVIDQRNLETGGFDEHKVMFGFANLRAATDTYVDSFADGDGALRVMDVRVMTVEELKKWLAKRGETKKEAGANPSVAVVASQSADAPITDLDERPFNIVGEEREGAAFRANLVRNYAVESMSLSQALDIGQALVARDDSDADYRRLRKAMFPLIQKRVREIAGEVPVFTVPKVYYEAVGGKPFTDGFYDSVGDFIVLNQDFVNSAPQHIVGQVILHEGIHAAFFKATWENPEIRSQLYRILDEARFGTITSELPLNRTYGLTNINELITEGLTTPEFQHYLAQIPASRALVRDLGLSSNIKTVWDWFVQVVRSALRLPSSHGTLLHALMRVTSQLEAGASALNERVLSDKAIRDALGEEGGTGAARPASLSYSKERLPERFGGAPRQEVASTPRLLRVRTMDQLAQLAKDYFGSNNPVRKIADGLEMIRVTAENILHRSEPIITNLYNLERQYRTQVIGERDGKPFTVWDQFVELVNDETMAGVFADRPLSEQTHLGKDALEGVWPKEQYARLAAAYNSLPADLKAARREAMAYFTNQQNQMSRGLIKNRLMVALGLDPSDPSVSALASRLFEGKASKDDIERVGEDYDLIMEAGELAKIEGPYFPLMRRGNFVVQALLNIQPPANALRSLGENAWEFANRDDAVAFAKKQAARPTLRSIWVDKNTGEPWFTDDDGRRIRVSKNDTDAEQRFRVTVQDRHVEFFETQDEALRAAAEYQQSPEFRQVLEVEPRRFEPGDRQSDMLSGQMQRMVRGLERREGYRNMSDEQKNELIQALNEASIRFLGSTRIQSRRLPRTYVEGASRDFTRNTLDYAQSTAGYLARLEHQPAIDAALKDMRSRIQPQGDYGKGGSLGRGMLANEVERRVQRATAFESVGGWHEVTRRVASVAFLRFLFSPAYSVVNSLQPIMLTYPQLAARYGAGRAAQIMFRAYDDIGGLAVARAGLRETGRMFRPGQESFSFFDDVMSRLRNDGERRMMQYLHDRGSIGLDAGLEIQRAIEAGGGALGAFDKGLGYLSSIGRQMPRAVETINRTASALAAYRLEMQRSGDHDAAVLYAQEATNLTQGLYSHTDAPPIFNHPLGRLSLQFKKYGQLVYGLLGHQIGRAIRNTNPGDRAEAIRALAITAGAHVVMAGALGLPTEPIKWLVVGLNSAGMTDLTWTDVEHYQRKLATEWFGQRLGEVVTRGVTRALPEPFAFDLSSRVGLQDLFTFGEPRSDEAQDIKAFLFDFIGGAPGSMVVDTVAGVNNVWSGDWVKGIEQMSPLKIASNSIRAYRQWAEGKKTAAGYEAMEPYSLTEAFIRGFGFTPGREAEANEQRSFFYSAQKRQSAERNNLMHEWYTASPSERAKMWGSIERWNKGRSKDERLTRADLDKYVKRRRSEEKRGVVQSGFRVTRRDRALYNEVRETYNVP